MHKSKNFTIKETTNKKVMPEETSEEIHKYYFKITKTSHTISLMVVL